jgi:hypothetical protein
MSIPASSSTQPVVDSSSSIMEEQAAVSQEDIQLGNIPASIVTLENESTNLEGEEQPSLKVTVEDGPSEEKHSETQDEKTQSQEVNAASSSAPPKSQQAAPAKLKKRTKKEKQDLIDKDPQFYYRLKPKHIKNEEVLQRWVVMNFICPEGLSNGRMNMIKIRACFPTHAEAAEAVAYLRTKDTMNLHYYIAEMGAWHPINPDPKMAENTVWAEKEMNDLAHAYNDSQQKGNKIEQERQAEVHRRNQTAPRLPEIQERMRRKLDERKTASQSNPTPVLQQEEVLLKQRREEIEAKKAELERNTEHLRKEHEALQDNKAQTQTLSKEVSLAKGVFNQKLKELKEKQERDAALEKQQKKKKDRQN